MALMVDLFAYFSVILHGLAIVGQSLALGSVLFLILLARPCADQLGSASLAVRLRARMIARWSAGALILGAGATVFVQIGAMVAGEGLSLAEAVGAQFVIAETTKIICGVLLLVLLRHHDDTTPAAPLLLIAAIELGAATLTTHAVSRLTDRLPLTIAEALHQAGAALWIGGIPCFVAALARCDDARAWRCVGGRFSRLSMLGVACIVVSGAIMSTLYIGDLSGLYGTAFGVMVAAKATMFLGLLGLGGMNFRLVGRLRRDSATPILRLKRFAEVEIGVGITLFFAAASLTSVPPAVDLTRDRVSAAEIIDRLTPQWPSFSSPRQGDLAIPALQAQLDAAAAARSTRARAAFIPGSGDIPPRNAEDIRWSEYNHHVAGALVTLIGLLAVLNQAGWRPARHWPLLFLGLAIFLLFRSDPESWPTGPVGFWDSLRDIEVLQHRLILPLLVAFGLFEWGVRTGRIVNPKAALVFPLLTALGGGLLLTHNHQIALLKDQLLIEITHTPMALAAVVAAWARWLELRLTPPGNRIAGWIWPGCFILIGLILMFYREA